MKTLTDYMLLHPNLVSELESVGGVELLPIFQLANGATLDSLLEQEYGDRTLFTKIPLRDDIFHQLAIVAMYKDSWVKLLEFNKINIPIGAYNARVLDETIKEDVSQTNQQGNTNKVSAFNSDDLITDTGTDTQGSNESDGLKVRNLTDSNINLNTAIKNLTALQKISIINRVILDIANYYTISIY